jgi:isocitrate dehydrogenase
MGKWSSDSKSHVAHMAEGDFFHNEKSITIENACNYSIEFTANDGTKTTLKKAAPLLTGEIIDATFMSRKKLIAFFEQQLNDAKEKNVLFSLHLKATMMKVSDPIMFGIAVTVFFRSVFEKFNNELTELGVDVRNGFGDLLAKIEQLPADKKAAIETEIRHCFENGPRVAMVNSDKGITNLHVPSDVIVDASMPAMIRNSGQMWDADGKSCDTKAILPDSSYASMYQVMIDYCKKHGAFDPVTMGTVPNVGFDDVPTACPIDTVTEPVVVSTLTPVPALTAVTLAAVYVVPIELPFHVPLVIVPTVAKFANDVKDVFELAVIFAAVPVVF